MELAGHKCIGFCEFDEFAYRSYVTMHLATEEQLEYIKNIETPPKKNGERNLNKRQREILKEEYRNGEWYANDITTVRGADIPRADIWTFGAPCQDFSIAGNRKGLDGDRSCLVREVFRLVREIEEKNRPKYLIYENVKGMLSSNKGWDFASILIEMAELGYDVEYQLFNSKDFGVPHSRDRVYTIGHLRGSSSRKVFPISGTTSRNSTKQIIGGSQGNRVYDAEGLSITLAGEAGGKGAKTGLYAVKKVGNINPSSKGMNGNVYNSNGISPALTTNKGEEIKIITPSFVDMQIGGGLKTTPLARCLQARYQKGIPSRSGEMTGVAIPVLTPDRVNKRQNGCRLKKNGEPMFTLTGQDRHGVMVKEATKKGYAIAKEGDSINLSVPNSKTRRGRVGKEVANTLDTSCNQGILFGCRIRRLTPLECSRLQGWEDKYFYKAQLGNSDSQLYKQYGNGVTVTVVKAIAEKLI